MSLFPQMILDGLNTSITGRAIDSGVLSIEAVDIRDFSNNKHMKVDDYPYGGGAGMVMQPGPVCDAYESIAARCSGRPRVVYMTPQGHTFNQHMAEEFAKEEELVILCGHYEGIDERALESIVTDYVSIGDYVLTGGELPAMVVIDSVSRLVPGVLNNDESPEARPEGNRHQRCARRQHRGRPRGSVLWPGRGDHPAAHRLLPQHLCQRRRKCCGLSGKEGAGSVRYGRPDRRPLKNKLPRHTPGEEVNDEAGAFKAAASGCP